MAKKTFETGVASAPRQEAIAQRAHEIWESEGRPEGRALDHWLRAVSELKAQNDGAARLSDLSDLQEEVSEKPRVTRRTTPRGTEKRFQARGQ